MINIKKKSLLILVLVINKYFKNKQTPFFIVILPYTVIILKLHVNSICVIYRVFLGFYVFNAYNYSL